MTPPHPKGMQASVGPSFVATQALRQAAQGCRCATIDERYSRTGNRLERGEVVGTGRGVRSGGGLG